MEVGKKPQLLERMRHEMRLRHMSIRTEEAYGIVPKQFPDFTVAKVAKTFEIVGRRNSWRVSLRNLFRDNSPTKTCHEHGPRPFE